MALLEKGADGKTHLHVSWSALSIHCVATYSTVATFQMIFILTFLPDESYEKAMWWISWPRRVPSIPVRNSVRLRYTSNTFPQTDISLNRRKILYITIIFIYKTKCTLYYVSRKIIYIISPRHKIVTTILKLHHTLTNFFCVLFTSWYGQFVKWLSLSILNHPLCRYNLCYIEHCNNNVLYYVISGFVCSVEHRTNLSTITTNNWKLPAINTSCSALSHLVWFDVTVTKKKLQSL